MAETNPPITIVVPVGPDPIYKEMLSECLDSIYTDMSHEEDHILIIDDMAGLPPQRDYPVWISLHKNNWLLGCAASWNIGVALSRNEHVLLMGSDDKLLPGCLDACREHINKMNDPLGFYNITCTSPPDEPIIRISNNAAVVTKELWKKTGGFPISAAIGAPDGLLISIMMIHLPEHIHQVDDDTPYYWVRKGPWQDGKKQAGLFNPEVISIRHKETERFQRPTWT